MSINLSTPVINDGLTNAQADELLRRFGPNELPSKKGLNLLQLLLSQFNNFLAYILLAATVFSYLIGDPLDATLILATLLLNIALGFWLEYKASKELEALRKLEVLDARILRDGKEVQLSALNIVPGDIVILESGDKIPADGKIIESLSLTVNESSLTGESLPVVKSENDNLYFATTIVSGRGKLKVDSTGVSTKFGKIALNLASLEEEKTPLQISLFDLGRKIGIVAVGVGGLTLVVRILQGSSFFDVVFGSIALMVAAVPEGLLAVVTVVLALGVSTMYKKKTLVRKMVAVESLGAATVICCDKTGTLTKNQMEVTEVLAVKQEELFKCAVLCNSASLILKENGGSYDILGDTTEGALLIWAKNSGVDAELIRSEGQLISEMPFNLKTRMMSIVWQQGKKRRAFSKGAPEQLIVKTNLTDSQKEEWLMKAEGLSKKGLRVLAFAEDKKFLGLIGISDPPRPEAFEAIAKAVSAGIRVVMITGDNELTAKAIAESVGLMKEGDEVLTGMQLDELTDEELEQKLYSIKVFARTFPEQKLRIVKAYQKKGEIVAVTGDGVNDSLALKQAQIGVAMGQTGTDVAKEASDIVILDDNFSSLIAAVEQGRLIYSNIVKVVKFLFAGNLSESLLIVGAILMGLPTPLLPAQILWVNFVTDGLPALALGMDSASGHLMKVPPRERSNLIGRKSLTFISLAGGIIGFLSLLIFFLILQFVGLQLARAVAFTLIIVSQMIMVFFLRRHHSIFSNKYLLLSVMLVLIMQLLILIFPPLRQLFKL